MPSATDARTRKNAKRGPRGIVKWYLVAYNVLSALGWSYVLFITVNHLFNINGKSPAETTSSSKTASSALSGYISSIPFLRDSSLGRAVTGLEGQLPPALVPVYRRATSAYAHVGPQTAFVQTFAILEIVHVLLGWVRSPVQTTAMQVASRLFLVWGVVEQFEGVRTNPLYASMVFAWSATESIRYPFYACNLLGYEPYPLLYLRYTTFYALYPLGAGSEAFLIYATLPKSSPIPSWQSWVQGMWRPADYIRAGLFAIWWPGLYVMYTYMISQRRKVLGASQGRTLQTPKRD
ncbi:hypothetical protein HGRIS_002442 [Hohenbuehelia grisea]|uniref:Very-long-chain (3R)-3-hydroxyacyl-CoA dehydratase n=1 Tax=Hohenbuehelia grisea TaxID=104357 RepID=A0ABR3JKG3_9AGAR